MRLDVKETWARDEEVWQDDANRLLEVDLDLDGGVSHPAGLLRMLAATARAERAAIVAVAMGRFDGAFLMAEGGASETDLPIGQRVGGLAQVNLADHQQRYEDRLQPPHADKVTE